MARVYFKVKVSDLSQEVFEACNSCHIYKISRTLDGKFVFLGFEEAQIPVDIFKLGYTQLDVSQARTELDNGDWGTSEEVASVPFSNTHSLNFDGINDYVDFGDNHDTPPAVSFTRSFWIKPQNVSTQRVIFSKATDDGGVYGLHLYHQTNGTIYLQARSSGALRSTVFPASLVADQWQHLVLTFAGNSNMSGMKIYLDGVYVGQGSNGGLGDLNNTASTRFGQRNNSSYFSGKMNQVTFWDTELTAEQVTELYNSGKPSDPENASFASNLTSWYSLNVPTQFPSAVDDRGSITGTLVNMSESNFVEDVP